MTRPAEIRICEVGPRDGLQNEPTTVAVSTRIALIERLADTGLRSIEAGAFVSPRWIPQMTGSAEVLAGLRSRPDVEFPVLVPNAVGLEAALGAGARAIAVFAAASETFSRKNTNGSVDEVIGRLAEVVSVARASGLRVRGYVSCVLGCPFEGAVALSAVVEVARRLAELGCAEISLGDTIGVGTPDVARRMVEAVAGEVPLECLAVHFHDTYGQALANVLACLEAGVRVVDASVAGLGGCPFAPGASGNLATEDLVYMLDGLGVTSGVDLHRLAETGAWISAELGKPNASRAGRALAAGRSLP